MSSEQIKPGFKQTEVGVIPDEWEASTIGDNSMWLSGGTPSRDRVDYWSGTIPWISGSTLKSVELATSDQFLTAEGVSAGSKMAPLNSTLLLVRGSALHNEIRAGLVVAPVSFNQDVKALVPVRSLEPKFLTYYILAHSEDLLKLVSSAGNSAGVLDTELVQNFKFLKPPLLEQRAITTALSDVDALLAKLDQLIAKKRDLKQATMQQLLTGQTRLPGFSGEWSRSELKCLVSTPITDGPHMTPKFYEAGVPFLSVNNLVDNRIDLKDLRYISKEDDLVFSRKCKPKVMDVLLGKAASVGKVAIVEDDFDFNIWSPIALVRAGNSIVAKFLYYQLLSADCAGQIALLTNSSSQGNIGMGDIEKLQISYPGEYEQTAIATFLSEMDTELATLEARRDKTRTLKQGMMQELLSGNIRLI